jgi:hypothetical protein
MSGIIYFDSTESLVAFLKAFTGCTATFEVKEDRGMYTLTFTGGF